MLGISMRDLPITAARIPDCNCRKAGRLWAPNFPVPCRIPKSPSEKLSKSASRCPSSSACVIPAAHVLATAIAKLWPDAQFAGGPPVENGFYYDVDLSHRITPDDFPKIEEEMTRIVKENQVFEKVEVSRDEALELAQRPAVSPPSATAVCRAASKSTCSMTFPKARRSRSTRTAISGISVPDPTFRAPATARPSRS